MVLITVSKGQRTDTCKQIQLCNLPVTEWQPKLLDTVQMQTMVCLKLCECANLKK